MSAAFPYPLASTDWLGDNIGAPDIRVVDASWRMPGNPPAADDYMARHIPGAVFFDLDEIADKTSGLPHMLPAPALFADAVAALGVSEKNRVIVYDDAGLFSAARVWWTFRAMGHDRVSVLEGGLPKWRQEGRPVEAGAPQVAKSHYRARPRPLARRDDDVRDALLNKSAIVLDARPAARFTGEAPEPRAGLRRGHMPGARSLPHASLLTAAGALKPETELREVFAALGVSGQTPVIATCGSGVTAAVIALALETIGQEAGLYDGSWTEWGREINDPTRYPTVLGTDD